MKQLHTPSEVIDALGGNATVARIVSTPEEKFSAKRVWNWRKTGFPSNTFIVLQAALAEAKCAAPARLWDMIPAPEASTKAKKRA